MNSTKKTKQKERWKLVRGSHISSTPVLPGVWARKDGGHVVRGRATCRATGRLREVYKVLPTATAAEALAWLQKEQERVRAGAVSAESPKMRFAVFASDLAEHKVTVGDIKSAVSRERWRYTLEHLIKGTDGEKAKMHVDAFGDFFVECIRFEHVEAWRAGIAQLISAGDYAPTTANSWLSIFRVIMKAAKRRFQLAHLATEDVKNFDTSEHSTYTEEDPNALCPEEVPIFLESVRANYPQHYAMALIGFVTGLRPSSLRPLRRRGPEADVLWDKARLLVRRSQTIGDQVMKTTKQKRRYAIDLPEDVMTVLRWHVDTQLTTPEMQDSDLLFPSVTGGFRSASVLNKPFADIASILGLGKKFTQRGLRRTFQDLARAAQVEGIVTRSISGHATERMQDHYSTVHGAEQRAALGRVLRLVDHRHAPANTARAGEDGGEGTSPGGEDKKKAG